MKTSACRSKAFKLTSTPFYNKLKLTAQAIRLQITMIYILQFTLVSIVTAKSVLSWRTVVTPYVGMAPQKMAATLKCTNDTLKMSALSKSKASISHIRHY